MVDSDRDTATGTDGMKRRGYMKLVGGVGAVGGAGMLAGCMGGDGGDGGDGTATPGSNMGGGELTSVTVGVPFYGMWSTTYRTVLAREQGYFEEEGLEVERLDVGGGGANVRAVLTGDADVAMSTGAFAAWAAYFNGEPVQIANALNADDHYWFAAADADIDEWSSPQCDGVTLGFSNPGGSSDMISASAIEEAGCEGASAESIGGPSDNLTAVQTGQIDLGWDVWSLLLQPHEEGTIKVIFDGAEIPPWGSTTSRTIISTEDWMNSDTGSSYFTALQRGHKFGFENMQEGLDIVLDVLDPDLPEVYRDLIMNQAGYEPAHLDPNQFKGRDVINELAAQNDFVDEPLSGSEMDDLINTDVVPSYDSVSV